MKLVTLLFLFPLLASASTEDAVKGCISAWKGAPFSKSKEPDQVVTVGVKVFGIGKKDFEDTKATGKARLVLIKPSVNVLGVTHFTLMNPNGWYCFKGNVSVLGKIAIKADCKAHLAASSDNGASVLGSEETDSKGVTVLGSMRIERVGSCNKSAKNEKSDDAKSDEKSED